MAGEVAIVLFGMFGAAIFLAVLAAQLPDRAPEVEPAPRPREDLWPAQLVRIERTVEWAAESGLDAHLRLRPVLVEIAEMRLARRGLRLDRDAGEAQRLLGPSAWELVRPDRQPPPDRYASGIGPGELDAILDALEKV